MSIAFISNLAGPDLILILLIVLLLFGAKQPRERTEGRNRAMRKFLKISDEEEREIVPRPTVLPPHLATPPFVSRLAGLEAILILLIVLCWFWLKNRP